MNVYVVITSALTSKNVPRFKNVNCRVIGGGGVIRIPSIVVELKPSYVIHYQGLLS